MLLAITTHFSKFMIYLSLLFYSAYHLLKNCHLPAQTFPLLGDRTELSLGSLRLYVMMPHYRSSSPMPQHHKSYSKSLQYDQCNSLFVRSSWPLLQVQIVSFTYYRNKNKKLLVGLSFSSSSSFRLKSKRISQGRRSQFFVES